MLNSKEEKERFKDKDRLNGESPCHIWKGNILSSAIIIRKMSYFLSTKPKSKKKKDKNASSELNTFKYVPPDRKVDKPILRKRIHVMMNPTDSNFVL